MDSTSKTYELMNENVEKLALGVFVYNRPRLSFSTSKLEISASPNKEVSGEFSFDTGSDAICVGTILTTSPRMRLSASEINASSGSIRYYFLGVGMEEGDVIKGDIVFITNCGEYTIPYVASRHGEAIASVIGPVRNLFHFANLARDNFAEAVRVFYSEEFSKIFIHHDRRYLDLYRGLSNTKSPQNVEEFLISIKKKSPISYSLELEREYYECDNDEFIMTIPVRKHGWGYDNLEIATDSDALSLNNFLFESEDFTPDAKLVVRIDPLLLHDGKNYVKLILRYCGRRIENSIILIKNKNNTEKHTEYIRYQAYLAELEKTYIDFRIHNISKAEWEEKTLKLLDQMDIMMPDHMLLSCVRAHVYISMNKIDAATPLLSALKDSEDESISCYKLYLNCLINGDRLSASMAAERINGIYRRNRKQGILWLLLHVDENLRKDRTAALTLMRRQADISTLSPLICLEAYHIFVKNPELLEALGKFELCVLNFAAKTGLINDVIIDRLLAISQSVGTFNPLLHSVLSQYYEEEQNERLLLAICSHLIRGEKSDKKYNRYYKMAIEQNLRITRLYEYYLYSLEDKVDYLLPRTMRMYFSYGNDTSPGIRSRLYANLLKHKDEAPQEVKAAKEEMITFALKQLSAGNINSDIAAIVNEYPRDFNINSVITANADELLFTHRICVEDPDDTYIVVVEKPFEGEKKYPVKNNECYIKAYSKDYTLFEEKLDGRRVYAMDITDEPLLDVYLFADGLYLNDAPTVGVAIALCELEGRGVRINKDNEGFIRALLDSDEICEDYKREYRKELLDYYYDNDRLEPLDELLCSIDPKNISPYDRDALVEHLIRRDFQDEAYGIVGIYGGENIDPRLLVKLSSRLILDLDGDEDGGLIYLSYIAFLAGKYNVNTLSYLTQHYNGTAKQLRDLHRAASNFELETIFLEERILKQMLFTGSFAAGKDAILEHYFKSYPQSRLSSACISYDAWEYFVCQTLPDSSLFERIIALSEEDGRINEMCALALIHHYSEQQNMDEVPEIVYASVRRLLKTGIFFPFFLSFADKVEELALYENRSYVEYRSNPSSVVKLHYILEGEQEEDTYKKEELKEIRGGIFLKSFLLFYGETLQYYVTEEYRGRESLTESREILKSDITNGNHENKYDVINDMLFAMNNHDDKSLLAMMDLYIKKDYITDNIFKLKGE